jgi:hypothetical protein
VLPVADDGFHGAARELVHEPVHELLVGLLVAELLGLADLDAGIVHNICGVALRVPVPLAGGAHALAGVARLPLEAAEEEAVPCYGRGAEVGGEDAGIAGVDVRGVDEGADGGVHWLAGDEARQVLGDGVPRLGVEAEPKVEGALDRRRHGSISPTRS